MKTIMADVNDCFTALGKLLDIRWDFAESQMSDTIPDATPDATGILTVGDKSLRLGLEIKSHLRRSLLGRLQAQLQSMGAAGDFPILLCTDYVEPNLAVALRASGIPFVDKAGNAYLKTDELFICIQGQPKPLGVHKRERSGRAFQGAGLRLVFELLRRRELAACAYRELAGIAEISLFAVKQAMDDLKDKGYLIEKGKGKRYLHRQKALLDEWSVAYRDRLRPELLRSRYEALRPDWWETVDLTYLPACWGGEIAATEMGLMRNPQIHTIYCHGNINALISAGRLRRDDAGTVEILEAFWHDRQDKTIPDLVVYADLITSGIERNLVTAQELYGKRIARQFT